MVRIHVAQGIYGFKGTYVLELIGAYFGIWNGAIEGPLVAWPITIILIVVTTISAYRVHRRTGNFGGSRLRWAVPHLLIVASIPALGAIFRNSYPRNLDYPVVVIYVVYALLLSHFLVWIKMCWGKKTHREFFSILSLGLAYLSFWMAFMSIMTITGDWI